MKVCYLTLTTNPPPTRDAVYLDGLRALGVTLTECRDTSPGVIKFWRLWQKHRQLKDDYDIMLVGFTSHILVPFARLISRKPIIFNALASLYEGMIVSRQRGSKTSLRAIYYWLLDWLVFHSATLSLVETGAQKKYLQKKFFLPEKKLLQTWTGADDTKFFFDSTIKKLSFFTVLFRGGFLPEAGVEYLIEAAHLLRSDPTIKFRIIGSGLMQEKIEKLIRQHQLNNIEWIKERLPDEQLRIKMAETHISLGQLSNHERLQRTIPHKAFESLAMKLPYLTAEQPAILELLANNENCLTFKPASALDLVEKIKLLKSDPKLQGYLVENGYAFFQEKLRPQTLAQGLLNYLNQANIQTRKI